MLEGLTRIITTKSKMPMHLVAFHLHSFFPGYPKVASGQEACDSVSGQMVDPTLFPQLSHYRIDPRKSRLSLLENKSSMFSSFLFNFKKADKGVLLRNTHIPDSHQLTNLEIKLSDYYTVKSTN